MITNPAQQPRKNRCGDIMENSNVKIEHVRQLFVIVEVSNVYFEYLVRSANKTDYIPIMDVCMDFNYYN